MSMEHDQAWHEKVRDLGKNSRLSIEKLKQQWNTLDPHHYGEWPVMIKIMFWLLLFLIIIGLGSLILIQPKIQEMNQAIAQESTLLDNFRKKDSQLRNLQQYQTQLAAMQANFIQQLEALPKETEIPGLIEDIHMTGSRAGLKLNNIVLGAEIQHEFLIEQPISIIATGDYHAFGRFISMLAQLSRIVTLHDFVITATKNPDRPTDIPLITYQLNAKTYRYIGASPAEEKHE